MNIKTMKWSHNHSDKYVFHKKTQLWRKVACKIKQDTSGIHCGAPESLPRETKFEHNSKLTEFCSYSK